MLYPGAYEPHPRRKKLVLNLPALIRPVPSELHLPPAWGLPYEDVPITTSDGVVIRAYLILQPEHITEQKGSIDFSASSHSFLYR